MSHSDAGPLPGQPGRAVTPRCATLDRAEYSRAGTLLAINFPAVPSLLRWQAAFVLAVSDATSDAVLLIADALDEATAGMVDVPTMRTEALAAIEMARYLRDVAPRFADRPLP